MKLINLHTSKDVGRDEAIQKEQTTAQMFSCPNAGYALADRSRL